MTAKLDYLDSQITDRISHLVSKELFKFEKDKAVELFKTAADLIKVGKAIFMCLALETAFRKIAKGSLLKEKWKISSIETEIEYIFRLNHNRFSTKDTNFKGLTYEWFFEAEYGPVGTHQIDPEKDRPEEYQKLMQMRQDRRYNILKEIAKRIDR